MDVFSEAPPHSMLRSALVRKACNGSKCWSYPKECQVNKGGETLSLTMLAAVLAIKASNDNRNYHNVYNYNHHNYDYLNYNI